MNRHSVALDERNGDVIAVGERAYQMVGRTPKKSMCTHPLKGWGDCGYRSY